MPVNPYENLTAVACLRTEAARKGRYGQFAGSADTSQAKCKLGLTEGAVTTEKGRLFHTFVILMLNEYF